MNTIICPGCGWTGEKDKLGKDGQCPSCDWENGLWPNRLLTVGETISGIYETGINSDVNLCEYTKSVIEWCKNG